MTGLWFVSYIVLWLLVIALSLLMIGSLRQIVLLQRGMPLSGNPAANPSPSAIRPLEFDGPPIGTPLPSLTVETINGFGVLHLAPSTRTTTLLACLSPMCEGCQHAVDPLNRVIDQHGHSLRTVVILRGDEQACRAFLSVFPLRAPVVCDSDRSITMGLDVHRNPFGLLYDEDGVLARKGVVITQDNFLALLGETTVAPDASRNIFPPIQEADVAVT